MSTVFLNGEYIPLEKACIHVMDRGFIFADGVYEVIPVFNQHIFRLDEHLQRLNKSLNAVYIENPYNNSAWYDILNTLIKSDNVPDKSLYIQVTRGISERNHDIDPATSPTVFAMCKPIQNKNYDRGIKAITYDDIRWQYCHIKAITLLPSVMLRHLASEKGAREAILIRENLVTEGAASNVFLVKDNTVITPPDNGFVLPGITRNLLIELLNDAGVDCKESQITLSELQDADEIWITSSTWEIVPVIELDGRLVGDGVPGAFWCQANSLYQDFKARLIN
jgi:D-alanine transaminase